MAIQRYSDSFGDLMPQSFSAMMDRFFNDSVNSRGRLNAFMPHVDAYETEKSYEIEAALPGLKREDIKVEFQHGRLSISGERRLQQERQDRRYHLLESQYGSFQRSFQLPDVASAQGIEAQFEDGVLRISVPKDQQKTMRHQIQIRSNQAPGGQVSERMGQQATDIPVESGATGNSQAGAGRRETQPAYSNAAMASGAAAGNPAGGSEQPGSGTPSWTNPSSSAENYGDGHPDDGAGSERRV
ncbi:Hsp20/alpha crystallin family protein [Hymenobacter sp. 15J16-1T3B]|uniref:Hsp20/alpha crystallin family protein n=1 Tax=Hymenobacter sp. 15J16-1T3B TaxID=2886941 RepID=UPI001D126103|nr:Hsp20/alpha crystallin family protein [Hymenobacter sp. 15J16-1T3B]MCC3160727.1 Hsp20/alpha crystallin family protein [Hymenobacter sp. 15J16-1T3B]